MLNIVWVAKKASHPWQIPGELHLWQGNLETGGGDLLQLREWLQELAPYVAGYAQTEHC